MYISPIKYKRVIPSLLFTVMLKRAETLNLKVSRYGLLFTTFESNS